MLVVSYNLNGHLAFSFPQLCLSLQYGTLRLSMIQGALWTLEGSIAVVCAFCPAPIWHLPSQLEASLAGQSFAPDPQQEDI